MVAIDSSDTPTSRSSTWMLDRRGPDDAGLAEARLGGRPPASRAVPGVADAEGVSGNQCAGGTGSRITSEVVSRRASCCAVS